jgi:hypothetical protein
MLESNQAVIQTEKGWESAFHGFGPASFLGMTVLHNMQVKTHVDSRDDRRGFEYSSA